ncbi:ATP-binding cassette domain-containing protein [Pseudomonas sp. S2_F03]
MDLPTDRDAEQDYLNNPNLQGQLRLKQVDFAYPSPANQPNPKALIGIDLSIAPGERVAILGRIGSGKSTLLRVMSRLYRPVDGQMFCDGLDVSQIDPADWRKTVGYVSQDARLFYGTPRENVMIGKPEASAEEFLRVLRLTGLDQMAAAHPRGINLPIGEMGEGVSGGQRQLISLARTSPHSPSASADGRANKRHGQSDRNLVSGAPQARHRRPDTGSSNASPNIAEPRRPHHRD